MAQKFPELNEVDARLTIDLILSTIAVSVGRGERVELRGFGTFSLHLHPPTIRRNPKTGEVFPARASKSIHFRPGKQLRLLVQQRNALKTAR